MIAELKSIADVLKRRAVLDNPFSPTSRLVRFNFENVNNF